MLTARRTAAAIAAGELTAEQAVAACFERIAAREPQVGAWHYLDQEAAMAAARALDARGSTGVLHGVPLAVKDVIDTADMPTGYGSALYDGFRPAADAACVAITRAKGAVVLGKTVSTEFAFRSPGKTTNPHNPAHTPGGSSSGSAAAVAAGMVPVAFGTQTAGSVIRPASYCGVVGYKPSFGLIERTGVKTLSTSFDTVGVLASDVADAAFLAAAAADRPALAEVAAMAKPRIGIYRPPHWSDAEPCTVMAMERAMAALARFGCPMQDVAPAPGDDQHLPLQEAVMDWEVLHAFSFERLFRRDRLAPTTRAQIAVMEGRCTLERYEAAYAGMMQARAALPALFGDCDVLLTPAASGEAPLGLEFTGSADFNRGWTMLHVPCVAVPAGTGPAGLPVGVQIVGRLGDDGRTLAAAMTVEAALRGH